MEKYSLITTADERTWPSNMPVLFLGEWCKRFSRKSKWSKLNFQTLDYHWDDRSKLSRDYLYLKDLHELFLKDLSKHLNKLHKVNYSDRYWRILIGPWLGYFIQILFDRWSNINKALQEYEIESCYILNSKLEEYIPDDMHHFIDLFVEDGWNEFIYGQILHFLSEDKIKISYLNTELNELQTFNNKNTNNTKKTIQKFFLQLLSGFLKKDQDYFIYSPQISIVSQLKLQIKLKQFPSIWRAPRPKFPKIEIQKRLNFFDNFQSKDNFRQFVSKLIPTQIPIAYLEGFDILKGNVERISWPKNPKSIFASNSYIEDEIFKAWTAEKTEQSIPLILAQHGGHFGMSPFAFYEEHQLDICDKFLTWGWDKSENSKITKLGNFKVSGKKNKFDSNGFALMDGMNIPRYSYHIYAASISSQWLSYFDDQCSFISLLNPSIRKELLIRLYGIDYGWDQKLRWESNFSDLKFDLGKISIEKLYKKSRLCIVTYNATTYLETLYLNIPTIAFWNEEHWELNEDSKKYIEILFDAGIYHKTPKSAAQKVSEIWDDIGSWWESEIVQNARQEFCERFSKNIKKPLSELQTSITNT